MRLIPDKGLLWQTGDRAERAIYIVSGSVEHVLPDGFLLSVTTGPALLGAEACIAGLDAVHDARALGPITVIDIEREVLLQPSVEVLQNLARTAHQKMVGHQEGFDAMLLGADARLERVLAAYARACGETMEDFVRLRIKRTQTELASAAGLTLRHTNRLLLRWQEARKVARMDGAWAISERTTINDRTKRCA